MTPEQIAELEALEKAATREPWCADADYLIAPVPNGRPGGENIAMFVSHPRQVKVQSEVTCKFVAALRNAAPELFATIRTLRAQLAEREVTIAALRTELEAARALTGFEYESVVSWFERAPLTYLPGLLISLVQQCTKRPVFKEGGLLAIVNKSIDAARAKAAKPSSTSCPTCKGTGCKHLDEIMLDDVCPDCTGTGSIPA